MKKIFWVFLILAFLFLNEYLSKFLLAIFVGNLEFSQAIERTFQYATAKSYLFSAGFRIIPFVAIGLFAAKSSVTKSIIGKVGIWIITLFTISFILYGYLGMQHSLFTDEHTSSTSALALIWIPIWAFLFVVVGAVALVVVSKIANFFQTHA
jgi:Na+/proline symporter